MFGSMGRRCVFSAMSILLSVSSGCAARGRIATPDQLGRLSNASGLRASGKITLSGPAGRFSTPLIFGVSRPDSLRIEIPAGTGLRFLLVTRAGKLRADLPGDDAMFEGSATRQVMEDLFGVDVEPRDLVDALLGGTPVSLMVEWRFQGADPVVMTARGRNDSTLRIWLNEPAVEGPGDTAFLFPPPRLNVLTLPEMANRLGLRR